MRDEIQILSEVQAVRQNPWMYIGSVGEDGAHHMLYEIVHNALDEAVLGYGNRISVTMNGAECEIEDNGRGIPTEVHSTAGLPSCEVALTRLHAGSKFNKGASEFTAGLHGVGLSCVNALSSSLELTVDRKGRRFSQKYVRGVAQTALNELGASDRTGTKIRFIPDSEIFRGFTAFDAERCRDFVEDLALLNPGIEFRFRAGIGAKEEVFRSTDHGITALADKYSRGKRALFPQPVRVGAETDGLIFEALFCWTAETESTAVSFVNCVRTVHGGTHMNAFRAGLLKAVNQMMREIAGDSRSSVEMEEMNEGLAAVLNCKVAKPNFESQTKTRFTNMDVAAVIERAVFEQTRDYFQAHPKVAALVFERITDARNARLASRRVGERVYYRHGRQEINEEVYKEQFGARSKNWHDSAVWITHEELLRSHADLCEVNEDAVALDVCCGSGVVGASFKSKVKKVIGLDLTPEMVNLAKQRLDEVVQGNVYNIPFPDNSFDLVCTREVLHLLPYPERPVSEIFRVLKPGGQFIVGQILPFSEDDAAWMYRVFKKKQPLIFNMFQEEDFRRMLLSAGFIDLEMTEMNVWESIDVWIDSYETTPLHRHEIRELFRTAPQEAKAVHPFKINAAGEIDDLWRWCVFSVRKPK